MDVHRVVEEVNSMDECFACLRRRGVDVWSRAWMALWRGGGGTVQALACSHGVAEGGGWRTSRVQALVDACSVQARALVEVDGRRGDEEGVDARGSSDVQVGEGGSQWTCERWRSVVRSSDTGADGTAGGGVARGGGAEAGVGARVALEVHGWREEARAVLPEGMDAFVALRWMRLGDGGGTDGALEVAACM